MLGTQDILMLGPKDGGWKKGVRALGAQASPGRGRKKRDGVPGQCWSSSRSTWSSLRDVTASFQAHQDFNAMRHNRETEGGLEGLEDDSAGNHPTKAEGPEFKSPGKKHTKSQVWMSVTQYCVGSRAQACWTCLDPGSVRRPVSRVHTHHIHVHTYTHAKLILNEY